MEITFSPEPIATIGQFTITNTFLTSFLSSLFLLIFTITATKKLTLIPNFSQNVVEFIIESLHKINFDISADNTRRIFPWFATFFLFILVSNWIGLLPGFGTIGFNIVEHGKKLFVPFLRPANTDLNMTLGLALISLVATHVLSIRTLGLKQYSSRFVSLNPINLFVGLLEIVSEFTKVASLSLRLFGNVFAGEALLLTTASFLAFVAPLPFIILEIVVGLVQALIFSMLTMVFMSILMTAHGHAKEEVKTTQ